MKSRNKIFYSLFLIILVLSLILHIFTGIFDRDSIDKRDLKKWNYNENQKIINTSELLLKGNNQTCWILIHSFVSTPKELYKLGSSIHKRFNDTVFIPRLRGHGEVPSKILNESLHTWYTQLEKNYNNLNKTCKHINVLGSSYGGSLSIKLGQDKKVKNLYLINAHSGSIYDLLLHLDWLLEYTKKPKVAQINSKIGLNEHIAYINFPLKPTKLSLSFLDEINKNNHKISSPTYIAHSKNDKVSNYKNIIKLYKSINSSIKKIKWYNESNHVLLQDYNKSQIIDDIIDFEQKNR